MTQKKISILVDQFLENNIYRTLPFLEILNSKYNLEILGGKIQKSKFKYATHLSEEIFKHVEIKTFNTFSSIRKPYNFLDFIRIVNAIEGELMICYKFLPGMFIPSLLKKITKRVKLIVDLDDYDIAFKQGIDKYFTLGLSKVIKLANLIITGSRYLQEKYGGVYLPTPVNVDYFNREKFSPSFIRNRYQLDNAFIILYMGTFTQHKGIYEIFDIFSQLRKEVDNVKLLMVGGAKGEKKNEQFIKYGKLKCGSDVIFTGFRPHSEMPYFLSCGDLLLTPVRDVEIVRAQTPAKIAEAQSMGLPIISSSVGEYKNLIRDGVDGFLLNPLDISGFKEKILYLLENENEKILFGKNARANCIKTHSSDVIQKKLFKVLSRNNLI